MSGALGEPPAPVPQPMGSPGSANQQLRGPGQQAGQKPTGPQQHKPPGAQVSGSHSPAKQVSTQSKSPAQPQPSKAAPSHPSPRGAETRKQQQQQQATVKPKIEKEGVKSTPKKGTSDVTSVVKEQKKTNDMQKSKHHDVSDCQGPSDCMVCMVILALKWGVTAKHVALVIYSEKKNYKYLFGHLFSHHQMLSSTLICLTYLVSMVVALP